LKPTLNPSLEEGREILFYPAQGRVRVFKNYHRIPLIRRAKPLSPKDSSP